MSEWNKVNLAVLTITGATMTGLYAAGADGNSMWALLFLLALTYPKRS